MNIKYVFIGNAVTVKEIGEYNTDEHKSNKSCKLVFEKFCNSPGAKMNIKNKVALKEETYHFILLKNKIFILILADKNTSDKAIHNIINELTIANIHLQVDDNGLLNKDGKSQLSNIIYQNENKIQLIADKTKCEYIQTNEENRPIINELPIGYNEKANVNYNWTIIFIIIVIAIIVTISIPLIISASGIKPKLL